jgi:RNA polymerase sigma-70 factor, ECF subfamily
MPSLPEEEPESSLVARATRRDYAAFERLYSLYFDRVYRYVRLRVDNPSDAEDVTATVFYRAWSRINRFSPKHDASFAVWLYRLAHNLIVDTYRRARDAMPLDQAIEHEGAGGPTSDAETEVEWRLTLAELHMALGALTEEQREVVALRFVEGLSAREVGAIMGKQEGTVRGMQYRAIEALRRVLAVKGERARDR